MGIDNGIYKSTEDYTSYPGTPVTSVPPTVPTPTQDPLITDHVFYGIHMNAFSECLYCKQHYAKHLYQQSYTYYQSVPYNPWPFSPSYPIIYGTFSAGDSSSSTDERPSVTFTR